MDTMLYFVRHGETAANKDGVIQGQSDVLLDEKGLLQAELIAERLKNTHFDAIYSSDLSRAMITARKIADGKKIIATEKLREWNLGVWQGENVKEIAAQFPDEYRKFVSDDPDFVVPGGESSREFQARADHFLEELAKKHTGGRVLCISHGGFIIKVLKMVLQKYSLPRRPRIFNTSLSVFSAVNGGEYWQLVQWNDTAHLSECALDDI